MKTVKFLISTFIFASYLAGCDSESPNQEEIPQDNREELVLTSEIGSAVLTEIETKSGTESAFTNRTFDLIIKDNRIENTLTEEKTSAETDGNEISDKAVVTLNPKQYWDDWGGIDGDLKLAGVYPSGVVTSFPDNTILDWSAKTEQSEETDHQGSDLMLAYIESYKYVDKGTAANLQFHHALTKITINVGGGFYSKDELEEAKVTINNVVVSGKVSLLPTSTPENLPPVYTYTENTSHTNVTPFKTELSSGDFSYSYAAIVYPFTTSTEEANRYQIATITIGTAPNENVYYVKLPIGTKEFKAGENNVYNVSINKTDVIVTASVVNWTDVVEKNVIPSKLSFEISDVTINPEEGNNISITAGSVLYVSITDGAETAPNTQSTVYILGSDNKWELKSGQDPIYWDDLKKTEDGKYSGNTVTALLILDGDTEENRKNGDKIFTSTKALSVDIATPFELNKLTHPIAKFTITVETSGDDDADRINLADIQSVDFVTGWNTYAINATNTGIEETSTSLQATKQSDFVFVAYAVAGKESQGMNNTICTVVLTTDGITNKYDVNLGENKVFTAGNHYQYKVKITKTQITFTGSVVDWDDQKEEEEILTQL